MSKKIKRGINTGSKDLILSINVDSIDLPTPTTANVNFVLTGAVGKEFRFSFVYISTVIEGVFGQDGMYTHTETEIMRRNEESTIFPELAYKDGSKTVYKNVKIPAIEPEIPINVEFGESHWTNEFLYYDCVRGTARQSTQTRYKWYTKPLNGDYAFLSDGNPSPISNSEGVITVCPTGIKPRENDTLVKAGFYYDWSPETIYYSNELTIPQVRSPLIMVAHVVEQTHNQATVEVQLTGEPNAGVQVEQTLNDIQKIDVVNLDSTGQYDLLIDVVKIDEPQTIIIKSRYEDETLYENEEHVYIHSSEPSADDAQRHLIKFYELDLIMKEIEAGKPIEEAITVVPKWGALFREHPNLIVRDTRDSLYFLFKIGVKPRATRNQNGIWTQPCSYSNGIWS